MIKLLASKGAEVAFDLWVSGIQTWAGTGSTFPTCKFAELELLKA